MFGRRRERIMALFLTFPKARLTGMQIKRIVGRGPLDIYRDLHWLEEHEPPFLLAEEPTQGARITYRLAPGS